jgi:histidinol-phosphate aminotransferase
MRNEIKQLVRKHYLALQGYVSAGMEVEKSADTIFMNANENPYELPGLDGVNRYPKPQPPELLAAYAGLYGVSSAHIVATRGADEALVVLTKVFCEPHTDSIIQSSPAFGMYGVDARAMPADVIDVPLIKENGSFRIDVESIISAAKQAGGTAKMIFICSPNNPTGNVFERADILKICHETAGYSMVVLDETYIEFAEKRGAAQSLAGELEHIPNLIILRTLSKSYALAGMRMGCFLCGDTDFIALVKAKGLDAYPLPHDSIKAALHVVKPAVHRQAQEYIGLLLEARAQLEAAFNAHPKTRHIYPSAANFFLVEMEDAQDFIAHCAAHKVILRDFTSKPMTKDCVRISAGLPEENARLIALLNDFR